MENRSCFVCSHILLLRLMPKSKSQFPMHSKWLVIPAVKQKGAGYQEAPNMLWKSPLRKLKGKALKGRLPKACAACASVSLVTGISTALFKVTTKRLQCYCCLCFLISSPSILFSTVDLE